jgi:chromosomal replication initiation ATPase DnaA
LFENRYHALLVDVDSYCRSTGITIDAVRSASRSRILSRARALIAMRAIDSNVASLTQIARYFNRSVSAISRAVDHYRASHAARS